ncbi:MAG: hypothetical protein Q7R34_00755 [Dehalococcoidia bacterium]|nr:hypothetical protein [Dehalococcoidia bacterium]
MKIACVLIPHFPLCAEIHRRPELINRPVIMVTAHASRRVVLDFSPVLTGLSVDMPLQAAISRCKGASLIDSDMFYYQNTFVHILKNLEKVVPAVEDAGLGCAYLDVAGLEGIYGDRDGLSKAISGVIHGAFHAQIGIAQSKFPAYVAATIPINRDGQAVEVSTETKDFLKDYPVNILPVSWKTIERLRGFGLERLGQVATLDIGPLQAQFGREGQMIWYMANGIDSRPLLPRRSAETLTEHLTFPAPTATLEVILMAVESLLLRVFASPLLKGRCARLAVLNGQVSTGAAWQRRIAFKEPAGSKSRALFAIKSSFESITLPGPLEDMNLLLSGLTGETGRQESLIRNMRQSRLEELTEALQQLEVRLGNPGNVGTIFQVRSLETWSRIPERRQALTPFSL